MRDHYDFVLVGAGLFSSVFAHEAASDGKSVLIIEKRDHAGGNVYQEKKDGKRRAPPRELQLLKPIAQDPYGYHPDGHDRINELQQKPEQREY